jgi:hypothetical protein
VEEIVQTMEARYGRAQRIWVLDRGWVSSLYTLCSGCFVSQAVRRGKMPTKEKAKPVQEIRFGRIKAAIWENESQNGTRHNVTLQRLYVDETGQWQSSSSFGRDDLPLVAKVVDLAHSWIYEQGQESRSQQSERDVHF